MQKSWGSGSDRERRMGWLALAAGMGSVFVGTRILAPAASALLDQEPTRQAAPSTAGAAGSRFAATPSHPPQPDGEPATQSVTVSPDPVAQVTSTVSPSIETEHSSTTLPLETPASAESETPEAPTSPLPVSDPLLHPASTDRDLTHLNNPPVGRPAATTRRELVGPMPLPRREIGGLASAPISPVGSETRLGSGLPSAVGPVFTSPAMPHPVRGKDAQRHPTAITAVAPRGGPAQPSSPAGTPGIRLAPPRASEPLPERDPAASAPAASTPSAVSSASTTAAASGVLPEPTSAKLSPESLVKVHFGSVGSRKEATALKDRLEKTAGLKARIVRDGSGYRVQLGAFRDRANAAKLVDDLKAKRFQPQLEEGKITSPPVEAAPAAPEEP